MESAATMKFAEQPEPQSGRSRLILLRRLGDVVGLPASRINAFERSVAADLLIDILRQAPVEERRRVAARLAPLMDIPNNLCRLLLRDEVVVARELLDECVSLSDHDLINCAVEGSVEHCLHIARRRGVSETVSNALIMRGETDVILAVLGNVNANIAMTTLEYAVALSRNVPELCGPILRRVELRPSSAYVMFWWCTHEERSVILRRFAVSREVLQSSVTDMFAMVARDKNEDPVVAKALQFIERRQRSREAITVSRFDGLEHIIEVAAVEGLNPDLVAEIGALAGVTPLTAAKILMDEGGEAVAVLCKATGLSRRYLGLLWQAMGRPEDAADDLDASPWSRVQITYEMLAVDRAQTVIRYWNWALTSALTPELIRAIREGEEHLIDAFSAAERAAMLALGDDLRA